MELLRPGVFTRIFAELDAKAEHVVSSGLEAVAVAIEDDVKLRFVGQHPYGTPTPAKRGGPPSRISRTLEKSMTHTTPEHTLLGFHVNVGPKTGLYPTYGKGRVDSATYGYYLEVAGAGKTHIRFPFLVPAFDRIAGSSTKVAELFRAVKWF